MLSPFFLIGWGEVEIFSFEKGVAYILSVHVRRNAILTDPEKTASCSTCSRPIFKHKSNYFRPCNLHLLSILVNLVFIGYKQFDPSSMRVCKELKQIALFLMSGYLFNLSN
jgi:biotin synthase-related radical SAM superfamily protein